MDIGHYDHPVLVLHYFYIPELLAFSVLQFREASLSKDDTELIRVMSNYGEDVVEALGYEVDRLESEIQKIVPGIKHVDIEAHNPEGLSL